MQQDCPRSGSEIAHTVEETHRIAARLGAALEQGDVVILDGPLGAGKTTFTQGLAKGLKVKGRVTSPTFSIARVHRSEDGGPDLVHVDAYRLLDEAGSGSGDPLGELDALDLDTELDEAVVVAEWGAALAAAFNQDYLLVSIDREPKGIEHATEDTRVISWCWERAQ